jgi:hypothetical protein
MSKSKFTLLDLMRLANDAYGDGGLGPYFDAKTGEPLHQDHVDNQGRYWKMLPAAGDTLAAYIVMELGDASFNPEGFVLSQRQVLEGAMEALTTAIHDLERVQAALQARLDGEP